MTRNALFVGKIQINYVLDARYLCIVQLNAKSSIFKLTRVCVNYLKRKRTTRVAEEKNSEKN